MSAQTSKASRKRLNAPADDLLQPPRRLGRPSGQDLPALEARLVFVARELFFQNGYGATTMSDVALAARASKTTLYSRFPSKADLLKAIVSDQIDLWDTGAERTPLDACETLEELLLAYGAIGMRAAGTEEFLQLYRLIYSESGRFPELAEAASTRMERGIEYLTAQIGFFCAKEKRVCRDPHRAAQAFMVSMMGWSSAAILTNVAAPEDERRTWLRGTVRAFLKSLDAW